MSLYHPIKTMDMYSLPVWHSHSDAVISISVTSCVSKCEMSGHSFFLKVNEFILYRGLFFYLLM